VTSRRARAVLPSRDRRADSCAHTHVPPPLSEDQQLARTSGSRQMDDSARVSGRQCIQLEMRAHQKPGSPKLKLPGDTAQTFATTADMHHTLFSRKCLNHKHIRAVKTGYHNSPQRKPTPAPATGSAASPTPKPSAVQPASCPNLRSSAATLSTSRRLTSCRCL